MIGVKKYRYKPVYKKLASLNSNVQNKTKLFNFKKQKWKNILFYLKKLSKNRKRNCYYKFYDQNVYKIVRYQNYFSKNYKQSVITKKKFNLFYSFLSKNYLKFCVQNSNKLSNQLQNKINSKILFLNFIEKRLDVILFRSNFVLSIRNARQLILHKHVFVNNKVVEECSFLVKSGDCIDFSPKIHKKIKLYVVLSEFWPITPVYLQVNYKLFQIRVLEDFLLSHNSSKMANWFNLPVVYQSYLK